MNAEQKKTVRWGVIKAVEHFGSHQKLAEALGVDRSAVSHWKMDDNIWPTLKIAMIVEKITDGEVTARELRPDLFEEIDEA